MKKVGLLGGTFDPIHNGHLQLAKDVQEKVHLDEIWFIPVRINPLKEHTKPASCEDRIEMIHRAIEMYPNFYVNELECYREGPSYSIDTLKIFKEEFPNIEFYFIVGSDVVTTYDQWKSGPEILKLCSIIVAKRPGFNFEKIPEIIRNNKKFIFIEITPMDISSTIIRQKVKNNEDLKKFIPQVVIDYINTNNLYK